MLIPYQVDVPMERWPYANWGLILVTTISSFIIIVGSFLGAGEPMPRDIAQLEEKIRREHPEADDLEIDDRLQAAIEDAVMLPGALRPDRWTFEQLTTCLFVHGDFMHLIGNMLFLFVFGNAVNAKLDHFGFLLAYFLIGAFTSAAWLVFGDGRPLVGASGAIMGLVGMFLILYPRNDVTVLFWFGRVAGEFTVSSYWLILFYLVGDLFGTLVQQYSGVAYICHVAGAFAGAGFMATAVALGFYAPARGEENLLQFMGVQPKEQDKPKKAKRRKRVLVEED